MPYVVDAEMHILNQWLVCKFFFFVVTRSKTALSYCDYPGETMDIMGSHDAVWPKIRGTVIHHQGEDSFQGDTTTSCRFGNSSYIAGKLQLA